MTTTPHPTDALPLPELPTTSYLGDGNGYGYDASDMYAYGYIVRREGYELAKQALVKPIHDPAVTTPREVLVGESPVDRIAAPAQEQPISKADADYWLSIRPGLIDALAARGLQIVSNKDGVRVVEQQQAGQSLAERQQMSGSLTNQGDDAIEVDAWKVQVFGERCGKSYEISVVRESNRHGQRSWGWFGEDKLLVSHNGGPCDWAVCGFVWDQQIAIAKELCRRLNAGESIVAASQSAILPPSTTQPPLPNHFNPLAHEQTK